MSSATAAPGDRLRRPQGHDGPAVEVVYRRSFPAITTMPILLVALILAFAAFEQVRIGSIPPAETAFIVVVGPFFVVLSLLWAIVVWYGSYACIGETAISLHDMSLFFTPRARMIPWAKVKDVSLSGRRAVILDLGEGGPLMIEGVPEPEHLCGDIRARLPR